MVFGGTNSGTALATAKVAQEKKRVYFNNGAATSALTNEQCSPYTVHYAYDTVALAKGTGGAVVDRGGKTWFFLTADYAFGHALEAETHGPGRKAVLQFHARQSFLRAREHDLTVFQKGGGRVPVEGTNSEYAHDVPQASLRLR